MRKFFSALIVIPLFIVFVVFAVANRHDVTVSFDPFSTGDPAFAVKLPLFVLIIAVAILGVVTGGSATWLGQRRWRRAARLHEADARDARSQLADLRTSLAASRRPDSNLPTALSQGSYRRDKQGATL